MYEPISTAVTQASQEGASSILSILSNDVSEWDLGSSGLKRSIIRWVEQFNEVKLGISIDDISSLDSSIKEDLWLYTKLGVKIGRVTETGNILVQTNSNNNVTTIGSSES